MKDCNKYNGCALSALNPDIRVYKWWSVLFYISLYTTLVFDMADITLYLMFITVNVYVTYTNMSRIECYIKQWRFYKNAIDYLAKFKLHINYVAITMLFFHVFSNALVAYIYFNTNIYIAMIAIIAALGHLVLYAVEVLAILAVMCKSGKTNVCINIHNILSGDVV